MYQAFIRIYVLALTLIAPFHPKAQKWVAGRRNWRQRYAKEFQPRKKVLWMHVASLGEFEQGRPVMEAWRQDHPDWQVVLSFFSPSGYEMRKNYANADFICYLPADTRQNARDFIDLIRPDKVIFVKYEFWSNYLHELRRRGISTALISAVFRPGQPFFHWWGAFWRNMLGCFDTIFVQDTASLQLLSTIGLQKKVIIAGDTRIDRVLQLVAAAPSNPVMDAWQEVLTGPLLVVGSSWHADEDIIIPVLLQPDFQHIVYLIAPHEPTAQHFSRLLPVLPAAWFRFSELADQTDQFQQQTFRGGVVDSVGLLNTLYQYGSIAYIGGGFGKGIHNTLEPAAYGLPVIFGPNYHKFEEAKQLIARGGAFCVRDSADLAAVMTQLQEPDFYDRASAAAHGYLLENQGATQRIMRVLSETIL